MELCRNSNWILKETEYLDLFTNNNQKIKTKELESVFNSIFNQEILIKARHQLNKKLFLCLTSNKDLIIKIVVCSYQDIKSYYKRKKKVEDLGEGFIKPLISGFGFIGYWVLIEKFDSALVVSLSDYLKIFEHINKEKLIEFVVELILKIVDRLIGFKDIELSSVILHPDNIFFIFKDENYLDFDIKFKSYGGVDLSKGLDNNERKKEKSYYFNDVGTLGIFSIIYYCLNFRKSRSFFMLHTLPEHIIKEKLKKMKRICGITNLYIYFKRKTLQELKSSLKLSTFKYLLGITKEPPPQLSTSSLFTAFYLSSSEIIEKSLNLLIKNPQNIICLKPKYFYTSLVKRFSNKIQSQNEYSSKMLTVIFNFFTRLTKISKEKTFSASLPLVWKIFDSFLNIKKSKIRKPLKLIIKNIRKFSTFTILNLLDKTRILQSIYHNFSLKVSNIYLYYSYNPKPINNIESFMKSLKKPDKMFILTLINHIPVHIKLKYSYKILELLDTFLSTYQQIFNSLDLKENLKYRLMVLDIVYEVLVAASTSYTQNRLGLCYENNYCFRVSPLMVKCLYCNATYCVVCAKEHINLDHTIEFLSNFKLEPNEVFKCHSRKKVQSKLPHPLHSMFPAYEKFPVNRIIKTDNHFIVKGDKFKFNNQSELFICYYTEIQFSFLSSEDFSINFPESRVVYHNFKERLTSGGSFICAVPKLASGDTLGFGYTSDRYLFFTYNGMNLCMYISLLQVEVSVSISFKNHPVKPILTQPGQSLYTNEAFTFPDKSSILNYPKLLQNMIFLYDFRKSAEAGKDQAAKILLLKSLYKSSDLNSSFLCHLQQNPKDPFFPF